MFASKACIVPLKGPPRDVIPSRLLNFFISNSTTSSCTYLAIVNSSFQDSLLCSYFRFNCLLSMCLIISSSSPPCQPLPRILWSRSSLKLFFLFPLPKSSNFWERSDHLPLSFVSNWSSSVTVYAVLYTMTQAFETKSSLYGTATKPPAYALSIVAWSRSNQTATIEYIHLVFSISFTSHSLK